MTDDPHRDRGKFVRPKPGAPAGGYPRDLTPNTAPALRVTAAGLINIDGEERNAVVLEGDADPVRLAARLFGDDVALVARDSDPRPRVKPGQLERIVWSAMMWAADNNPGFDGVPEYTDGGNSFAEIECRATVRRILAALGE